VHNSRLSNTPSEVAQIKAQAFGDASEGMLCVVLYVLVVTRKPVHHRCGRRRGGVHLLVEDGEEGADEAEASGLHDPRQKDRRRLEGESECPVRECCLPREEAGVAEGNERSLDGGSSRRGGWR